LTEKEEISISQPNESNGFRLFAKLIQELGDVSSNDVKISLLINYFSTAPDEDKTWAIGLFTGWKLKRVVKTSLITSWVSENKNIPKWLFDECYKQVGDLAETIALLLPQQEFNLNEGDLADYIRLLKKLEKATDEEKKEQIVSCWNKMNTSEIFLFNKLISGSIHKDVSEKIVIQSLSKLYNEPAPVLVHRLSGKWDPAGLDFDKLVHGEGKGDKFSQPYPFFQAHEFTDTVSSLGTPESWHAEWKWDGIRVQLIKRNGEWFVWNNREELITDKLPEFENWTSLLPDGMVMDGVIIAMKNGKPLPSAILINRIGRIKVDEKLLSEVPVHFMAFDLMENGGEDCRSNQLVQRRKKLGEIILNIGHPLLLFSKEIKFSTWEELTVYRLASREKGAEGLMLKRVFSSYHGGIEKGDWWKWKRDPLTIDAVLIYAQKDQGSRGKLNSEYTFAVRDGEKLVSFAKASFGLTDQEYIAIEDFVKKNTIEKFGPVRTLKPALVFEISFDGISESKRHKSGIVVRFPRISKWVKDKKIEDINTVEDLKSLLGTVSAEKER
jgi:DNA ligase-1